MAFLSGAKKYTLKVCMLFSLSYKTCAQEAYLHHDKQSAGGGLPHREESTDESLQHEKAEKMVNADGKNAKNAND